MAKKSKKFDEATMTTAIKGYLAGRKVLDPYAAKREKKPDVPWYLKKSNDLEDMVRKHLGEERIVAEFELLTEAKFPGLTFGKLPQDIKQDILKLAKQPGKVNPSWRRWEALPKELQKKIEEFYSSNKDEFARKKKSGDIRMPYIKTPTKVGAKKLPRRERGGKIALKGRGLSSKEEYISDLEAQISKLKRKMKFEPVTWNDKFNLKALKRQLERVAAAGDDWRDVVAHGGKPYEMPKPQGPGKYIEADPQLQDAILKIIPKERQNRPSRGDVGPTSRTPLEHAIYRLQKVAGLIPTTPGEHAKLSKWAKDTVFGKHGGDLLDYAKGREFTKPGRAYGIEPQKMKIKTGHKAAPPAIRTTKRATDPMYGSQKTLRSLHRKMKDTPFHQQSKFSPPVTGRGKTTSVGSVGKILSKIYGKLATEYLYGKDDGPASFDEVLRAVNRRHPGIDLEDALARYTALAQKYPGGDEGLDDAPDDFIHSLKGKISPEEMKALMELSTLTDPNTMSAIKSDDFTAFERAMGPILRDIYAKGVETQAHPGIKAKYDSPDSPEDVEGALALSPVFKQELLRFLPLMLKDKSVTMDNVEEKAASIKQSNPEIWKKIENSVFLALKKRSPRLFKHELRMKKRRERAEEDENKIAYMQRKKDFARRKAADLDLTRRQIAGSEKSKMSRREFGVEDPESALQKQKDFSRGDVALSRAASRKHLVPRGGGDLSKSQRRELARMEEPRDPEELARRKAREPEFKGASVKKPSPKAKSKRKVSTYQSPGEYKKKKDRLDLIKQRGDLYNMKKKASNESKQFSIFELYEGFENSWDLDVPAKEEEWESAKLASKKDWMKDLTLESLVKSLTKKK